MIQRPSRNQLWRAIAFALVTTICFTSCGLFRRDGGDGGGGGRREQAESLGDYRLKAGSILALEMFEGGQSVMVSDSTVDTGGNLLIPRVGEVSVAGMAPVDAAKKIEFLARKSGQNHLGGPRIHIKALDRRAVVHISGQVEQSGPVTFAPGMTVADVIEAAGGSKPDANLSSVGLTTRGRKNIVTAPETKVLREGDVVNVPRRL